LQTLGLSKFTVSPSNGLRPDATVAAQRNPLITRAAIRIQDAARVREHFGRAFAMQTDGEVAHVQRFDHAVIRPHVCTDATTAFGGGFDPYAIIRSPHAICACA